MCDCGPRDMRKWLQSFSQWSARRAKSQCYLELESGGHGNTFWAVESFPRFFNYTVSLLIKHNPATQLGYTLCKDIWTTCFYRIYMSKLINTKYRQTKEVTEQLVRPAHCSSPCLSCIHRLRETIMCCPCALLWQNRGTNDDGAERWLCLS